MLVLGWMRCGEETRRRSTSWRQRSVSQSGSGAVIVTSTKSTAGRCRSCQRSSLLEAGLGCFAGAGGGGVAGDDGAVVGQADPAAGGVVALGVQAEQHRALGR